MCTSLEPQSNGATSEPTEHPSISSYRLGDSPKAARASDHELSRMLKEGPSSKTSVVNFAIELIKLQLEGLPFQVTTPDWILAKPGIDGYETTLSHLTFAIGRLGRWMADCDVVIRETKVGFPVAVMWVTESLTDDAERIAWWGTEFDIAMAQDLRVGVLTLDRQSHCHPAQRERKEALVFHAVDKVYWLGVGHPNDRRLTNFTELLDDVVAARAAVLHL